MSFQLEDLKSQARATFRSFVKDTRNFADSEACTEYFDEAINHLCNHVESLLKDQEHVTSDIQNRLEECMAKHADDLEYFADKSRKEQEAFQVLLADLGKIHGNELRNKDCVIENSASINSNLTDAIAHMRTEMEDQKSVLHELLKENEVLRNAIRNEEPVPSADASANFVDVSGLYSAGAGVQRNKSIGTPSAPSLRSCGENGTFKIAQLKAKICESIVLLENNAVVKTYGGAIAGRKKEVFC